MEAAQVNVYLDAETHQRLIEHKDNEGRSMSQMASRLIKEAMDRREAEAFDMGPTTRR